MPQPSNIVFTDKDAKPSRFLVDLNIDKAKAKPAPAKEDFRSYGQAYADLPWKERVNDLLSEKRGLKIEFLPHRRTRRGSFSRNIWRRIFIVSFLILAIRFSGRLLKISFKAVSGFGALLKFVILWRPKFGRWRRPGFILKIPRLPKLKKEVAYLAIIMLAVVLPLKALHTMAWASGVKERLLGAAGTVAEDLAAGADGLQGLDWEEVQKSLGYASRELTGLESDINRMSELLRVIGTVLPFGPMRAGQEAAKAADVIKGAAAISREMSFGLAGLDEGLSLSESLLRLRTVLSRIEPHARQIEAAVTDIDADNLPPKYRQDFLELKERSVLAARGASELHDWINVLYVLMGYEQDRRYLLVFQNNAEMRASGGFIGSYALLDFHKGEIVNLEVPGGGSYDTEAGMRQTIIAPEPLWLVRPRWYFWDSNWWPDWPLTARKLMEFYEKSDGPTVDGVISLTPTVMERFLEIIGPIDLGEKYGLEVHTGNFWDVTQALAERKPDQTDTPKDIIGDLFAAIIEQLPDRLDKGLMLDLIRSGLDLSDQKQILLYFKDEAAAVKLAEYDWTGEVKETSGDYLLVVNSNIAGAKSDRRIKQSVQHQLEIGPDGVITALTKISRSHLAEKGEEFSGQRNVNWLRVYVPAGSELVSAVGFKQPDSRYFKQPEAGWTQDPDVLAGEGQAVRHQPSGTRVYEELGKTVFANWSMIDPGQVAHIYLKYKLPFKAELSSEGQTGQLPVLVQKQPGMPAGDFQLTVSLPEQLRLLGPEVGGRVFEYKGEIDKDEQIIIKFKKQ